MLGYVVAGLAAAVAGFVILLLRARERRAKDREGVPSPPEESRLLIHIPLMKRLVDAGELLEFYREETERNGWKAWAWSIPINTEFIITEPADLKHAFHTNFENYTMASRKEVLFELLGHGIFTSDGERWREQRRSSSHLFTAAQLKLHMTDVFTDKARKLVGVVRDHTKLSSEVDIQRLLFCYTFDSISEVAFGRCVDSLGGNPTDRSFQDAFDVAQNVAARRFVTLLWQVYRALGIFEERDMKKAMKVIDAYLETVLKERELPGWRTGKGDILSLFQADAEREGRELERRELRDIAMNFMIAGRDTTAAASTWMMYELARHPDVLEKVREEVRAEADVDNMQYLQAVFLETLRIHPPVPFDSKTSRSDDVLPSGLRIPKGSDLAFNPCVFTMNPTYYPEPRSFLPERWMGEDGKCKQYDQWLFPQFNMGRRICLGRHMASVETKTVISELVSEFDFKLAEGFHPELRLSVVLQTRNGMMMHFHPRG